MFDLDGLEQVDPVALEVNFNIDGDVLSMRCPREGVTPHDVQKSFEQRGVLYANRIRFVLTDDGTRTLNPRSDTLPLTPAVIKLEGPGSVLTAVKAILGGGARPAASKEAKPPKKAGLGPVQRSAFRGYQAELHCRHAETAEYLQAANERRRSREEFLRNVEVRRKEEQDRWAREEAEWANRRRGQLPQGRS
ncbi:unnamed protein product [Effrenium voratum]|uniref:Uncharacterized protein n=1 Tax=Effrenium voratum TaxID=2562239 RepID=A0AA36JSM7_9DINO|nr:unnamed protein product [Effrenium voratum]